MNAWAMKRFWTEARCEETEGGWRVLLDARPIRTPAKEPLIVPHAVFAEEIAAEWDAQEDTIDPGSMPVTRSANAAIDKVRHQHAEVAEMLAAYGDSDLLCYRADAPADLVARQAATWDPYLDWAATALGARLAPRTGIMHQPQDPAALARLRDEVHGIDAFGLAAFHDLVSLTGSLVLGFAATRDFDPGALWSASRLDEDYQAELWGEDEEAAEMAAVKRLAFMDAVRVWRLSKGQPADLPSTE
ncbi:ATP12 chaperone protein [Roseivivax sp. THAF40]|uniref:ATP12 family chaperone protein n=1 Tax=Roseivivax sp. THAF40 TaxID=2587858 RepID=UPI0012684C0F|nr:ATP12 family protein [Roseivivax sp. THAF40]QFT45254.1 ATP12 chaperone protein [Roseivivax sp. THAF40]